jgi:hypothetical protein
MLTLDWTETAKKPKPTKKQKKLFHKWKKYLADSRLSPTEQRLRACLFAEQNREVPKD